VGVVADPELVERPRRRRFTAEYKLRIVRAADGCTRPGEIGALLRREGLYSSLLTEWRRARDSGALEALAPKRRGPARPPGALRGAPREACPGVFRSWLGQREFALDPHEVGEVPAVGVVDLCGRDPSALHTACGRHHTLRARIQAGLIREDVDRSRVVKADSRRLRAASAKGASPVSRTPTAITVA